MAVEIEPPNPDWSNIRKHLRDKGPLWRLGAWGGAAAVALAALAITTQTESASERLQLAFAAGPPPARAVATVAITPRPLEKDAETQRLETQVRALAADRDRLMARLASLERNLEDMTGSIKRQAVQDAAAPPAKAPVPAATPQAAAPAPAPSTPAAAPQASIAMPPAIAPLAMPAATDGPSPWPNPTAPPTAPPMAEPLSVPAATHVASIPATELAAEPSRPKKIEIGVDIGGAPSLDVLNLRWVAVKANFGPLLTGLHPRAVHNRRPGSTDYRLLVGPLPTAAAATHLCARFVAARVTCRAARFEGEQLVQR
jgi:hypothetical protein